MAGQKSTENKALAFAGKAKDILDGKKGEDIAILDVGAVSSIADYFLLVTGTSAPHLKAMADEVHYTLKHEGTPCYRRSGDAESGWIVLDYGDVIIHILSADRRAYYSIEDLWAKSPLRSRS